MLKNNTVSRDASSYMAILRLIRALENEQDDRAKVNGLFGSDLGAKIAIGDCRCGRRLGIEAAR